MPILPLKKEGKMRTIHLILEGNREILRKCPPNSLDVLAKSRVPSSQVETRMRLGIEKRSSGLQNPCKTGKGLIKELLSILRGLTEFGMLLLVMAPSAWFCNFLVINPEAGTKKTDH